MQSSLPVVLVLLASLANAIVRKGGEGNSIVRKEGDAFDDDVNRRQLIVEADGSFSDPSSHMHKAESLMAMSVSASGMMKMEELQQMESFTRAHSKSASLREIDETSNAIASKVWNMVHTVQDLVSTGKTPDKSQVTVIKEILEEELLPNLKKVRETTAAQVQTHLEEIKRCNSDANNTLRHISDDTESTVQHKRDSHALCREGEKDKLSMRGLKCKELDDWLDQIHLTSRLPEPRSRANMVDFVVSMDEYFCPKGCEGPPGSNAKVNVCTLSDACGVAESGHAVHKSDCDALQAQFESSFCTWRTEMADACFAQTNCYNLALKIYMEHVNDARNLLSKWKVEYGALQKILCYINVWLNDGNEKTVDGNHYGHCEDFKVDTSSITIDFGTPVDKATCSMTKVEVHPGDARFVTNEYGKFSDQVIETVACLELSTQLLDAGTTLTPPEASTGRPSEGTTTLVSSSSSETAKPSTTAAGDSTKTTTAAGASKKMSSTTLADKEATTLASKDASKDSGKATTAKMTTTPAPGKSQTTQAFKPTTQAFKSLTTEASKDSLTTEASKESAHGSTTTAEVSKGAMATTGEASKNVKTPAEASKNLMTTTTAEASKR